MKPDEREALAKEANRETWTLLERDDRTADDDERMVHAAHASAFHWQQAGGDPESARADWLLSHVYAVLGRSEEAARYARHCLATCERNGFGDFDLAYAYEAMARSCGRVRETPAKRRVAGEGRAGGSAIADAEDRDLFLADLAAEPWYGT